MAMSASLPLRLAGFDVVVESFDSIASSLFLVAVSLALG